VVTFLTPLTSNLEFTKGSIGHAFTVCIRTENQNQESFYPFVLYGISVPIELPLGHLCYLLTDVPPQPNSPPDNVSNLDLGDRGLRNILTQTPFPQVSQENESFPKACTFQLTPEKGAGGPVSTLSDKKNNYGDSGISKLVTLPPMLYSSCHFSKSD
jgi:hypothetical protein